MQHAGGGARPADWHPLASADPVPGDALDVGDVARRWRDVAEELERQAAQIRRLAQGSRDVGQAADALREGAEDLATRLTGAVGRYRATAGALEEYLPHLQDAQHRSLDALRAAREAQDRHDAAAALLAATSTPVPAPAPVPGDDVGNAAAAGAHARAEADRSARAGAARRDLDTATAALAAARAQLRDAEDDRDAAAERAARAITTAIDHDPLHDSRFDRFQQWVHEHADDIRWVSDAAGRIAAGAALFGLAVGWIPVIGQALAAVAELVALGAGIVALAGHVLLLASGDGTWVDVAVDVVGLATFGIGKVAGAVAKAAKPALGAAGTAAAASRAAVPALERAAAAEGRNLATHGVDAAGTALTMAALGKQAVRAELRAALGVSGKGVARMTAPTRAAWKTVDTDLTAAQALLKARTALGRGFAPTLRQELGATLAEARNLTWTNVRQAGADLRAAGVGGNLTAATQGLRDTATAAAGAARHPVQTYRDARAAVEGVGSVLGASAAARTAASVVTSTGLAFDGFAQAVSDLSGWSQDHVAPTVGGTSKKVLEGIAG